MRADSPIRDQYLRAEISPARLSHNLQILRDTIGPKVKLCIVAKANCYGHSLIHCLPSILAHADCIATGTADEAWEVRQLAPKIPIQILLPFALIGSVSFARELLGQGVAVTLSSDADLAQLRHTCAKTGVKAEVHLKIDTGMSRAGILPEQTPAFIEQVQRIRAVRVAGIFTHLATADDNKGFARKQLAKFEKIRRALPGAGNTIAHAAASAATLDLPESHYDMVRIGIGTFGYRPSPKIRSQAPLQGVMRLVTRLMQTKQVAAGTRVGYGLTYRFRQAGRLGLIPIGYADGYDRRLSNCAKVKIRGQWVPVRGRISMDQTSIDLTTMPQAAVGDEVEVISWNREDPNSVENLARLIGSIPYEITTQLGRRVCYHTTRHS